MNCPECKKEFHCGCKSCAPRHKANGVVCSIPDGDYDTCGHCGLRLHACEWMDLQADAYEEYRKAQAIKS